MPNFGNAFAVRGVVVSPVIQRWEVEVLAVDVDAFVLHELQDVARHPMLRLGNAVVKELLLTVAAQQPLLLVLVKPCPRRDALGLEPQEGIDASGVGMVGNGSQAVGEPRAVDLPRAHVWPTALILVPTGIHPPEIDVDAMIEVTVDEQPLIVFVGPRHFVELPGRTGGKQRRRQFSTRTRHVVRDQPATPDVLGADPIAALPKLQGHQRAADILVRQQLEVRRLLPAATWRPSSCPARSSRPTVPATLRR